MRSVHETRKRVSAWRLAGALVAMIVVGSGCDRCGGTSVTLDQSEFSTERQLQPGAWPWLPSLTNLLAMVNAPAVAARPKEFESWEPVVSFVHVSDAQIRDYGLKYFGSGVVRDASDWVAPEVKRLASVDRNDEIPFLALIGGLGKMVVEAAPAFVLHTGDAVDSGTVGELVQFEWIMNQLAIPWFNVIGNHDVLLMGNFSHDCLHVKHASSDAVPMIGDAAKFMQLHGPGSGWAYGAPLHAPTVAGTAIVPGGSTLHGFDAGDYDGKLGRPRSTASGRYSFPLYTDPPIRVVVLDTTRDDNDIRAIGCRELPDGYKALLNEKDKLWLYEQVQAARALGEYVIVAAHHPLGGLGKMPSGAGGASVTEFLRGQGQEHVLAFVGGHTHEFAIHPHDRGALAIGDGAPHKFLPEIINTATRVDPSFGLLIEVLRKDDRLAVVYRSIAARGTGELAVRLDGFCRGAAADAKRSPQCGADLARGFIVATGVPATSRRSTKEPTWDETRDALALVSATPKALGSNHGEAPADPFPCADNESMKTAVTYRIRNERDHARTIRFQVKDPEVSIVRHEVRGLVPPAVVTSDQGIPDTLDPAIRPEIADPVDIGRVVTIDQVPGRFELEYHVEVCSTQVRTPAWTEVK